MKKLAEELNVYNLKNEEDFFKIYDKENITNLFKNNILFLIENHNEWYKEYFIEYLYDDYLEELDDSYPSEMLENHSSAFYDFKKAVEEYVEDYYNDIFSYIYQDLNIDENKIKFVYDLNDYLYNELDIDTIINDSMNSIIEYLDKHDSDITEELKDMGIINNEVTFYELYDLDDTIGDSYTTTERIDYDTRDAAFVDVGGTCLVGENGQTHAQVIQDWFNTFAEDEDDEEYNPELQSKWHRPKDTEVESLTGAEYTVFGHILNDCIIIEDYNLNGVTMEDVISDIDKAGITYDKIYEYGGDEIQRVAKVVK